MSIGFDRDRERNKRELTNSKNVKGKYHVTIMLKEFLSFAVHQERGTYGLGYRLTLTRNSDNALLNKGNALNNAKIISNNIDWMLPTFKPNLEQQNIIMNQIVKKMAIRLRYIERSIHVELRYMYH